MTGRSDLISPHSVTRRFESVIEFDPIPVALRLGTTVRNVCGSVRVDVPPLKETSDFAPDTSMLPLCLTFNRNVASQVSPTLIVPIVKSSLLSRFQSADWLVTFVTPSCHTILVEDVELGI